jgi:hypothetical protein
MLVLAIQFELFVRAIVRVLAAVLLVATLLRDGLFDPGGIGLPPSLPYKADFVLLAPISIVGGAGAEQILYTCDINAFNKSVCLPLADSIDSSNRSHIPINRSIFSTIRPCSARGGRGIHKLLISVDLKVLPIATY